MKSNAVLCIMQLTWYEWLIKKQDCKKITATNGICHQYKYLGHI